MKEPFCYINLENYWCFFRFLFFVLFVLFFLVQWDNLTIRRLFLGLVQRLLAKAQAYHWPTSVCIRFWLASQNVVSTLIQLLRFFFCFVLFFFKLTISILIHTSMHIVFLLEICSCVILFKLRGFRIQWNYYIVITLQAGIDQNLQSFSIISTESLYNQVNTLTLFF